MGNVQSEPVDILQLGLLRDLVIFLTQPVHCLWKAAVRCNAEGQYGTCNSARMELITALHAFAVDLSEPIQMAHAESREFPHVTSVERAFMYNMRTNGMTFAHHMMNVRLRSSALLEKCAEYARMLVQFQQALITHRTTQSIVEKALVWLGRFLGKCMVVVGAFITKLFPVTGVSMVAAGATLTDSAADAAALAGSIAHSTCVMKNMATHAGDMLMTLGAPRRNVPVVKKGDSILLMFRTLDGQTYNIWVPKQARFETIVKNYLCPAMHSDNPKGITLIYIGRRLADDATPVSAECNKASVIHVVESESERLVTREMRMRNRVTTRMLARYVKDANAILKVATKRMADCRS